MIGRRSRLKPEVALVLGSGLGDALTAGLETEAEFAFETLPGFPPASVPGHAARLTLGSLFGVARGGVLRPRALLRGPRDGPATTLIPRLSEALGARAFCPDECRRRSGPDTCAWGS